jgi:hypothetical protein
MADRVGFAITVLAVWMGLTARVRAQSDAKTAMQAFRQRQSKGSRSRVRRGGKDCARPDQAAQHFSMTEELIRQEHAKTGDMGMSGTERKSFRREPAIL